MKDLDNIAAIAAAALIAGLVVIFKPDGAVLAMAGTALGGCLTYLQRRPVQ